ncbi:MAG: hypothetical protein ACLQVF_02600 [Isosphaeraceae bacterium]
MKKPGRSLGIKEKSRWIGTAMLPRASADRPPPHQAAVILGSDAKCSETDGTTRESTGLERGYPETSQR